MSDKKNSNGGGRDLSINKDRGLKPVSSGTPMPKVKTPAQQSKPAGSSQSKK